MTTNPTASDMKALEAKALHLLGVAVTDLILDQPFYASLILHLERVVAWYMPTMATDGKRLYYNPSFTCALKPAEVLGVLAHEACHVANLHCLRREGRDPLRWNLECDHVVNHIVSRLGHLQLPAGAMDPIDDTPERLYEQQHCKPPKDNGGNGGDNGTPNGSDGQDPGGCGGVMDTTNDQGQPLSGAELEEATAEAKLRVKRAMNAAKAAGKLPADMERHFNDVLAPVLPWREILARFVAEITRDDYTWRSPNKRYMASTGMYLPDSRMPRIARIIFAVDTSGSMGDAQITEAIAEVNGCLETSRALGRATLSVAWCDTEVHEQELTDIGQALPRGGGGTSFAPVIDHYADEDIAGIIYYTDGYCDDFTRRSAPPSFPVLWLLNGEHNASFSPPFGDVIKLGGGD